MELFQALQYNEKTDQTGDWRFSSMEDAMAFCEKERGEPLVWIDTEFGFQGLTQPELDELSKSGWPSRWYEVHGIDEDGEIRYLDDEEWPGE